MKWLNFCFSYIEQKVFVLGFWFLLCLGFGRLCFSSGPPPPRRPPPPRSSSRRRRRGRSRRGPSRRSEGRR